MNTTIIVPVDEKVTIGYVKAKVFWPVLLSAFLLLSGLVFLAFKGNIALAAELPGPYIIQGSTLQVIDGTIQLGVSGSNPSIPVAIITAPEEFITGLRISKEACLPSVGKVTFTISAGFGKTPAAFFGSRSDVQILTTRLANIQNQVASTNAPYGLKITAGYQKLYNVTINAPYISANSVTLPDATISVTKSGSC